MKYYLASRFGRQAEMIAVAQRLRAIGHDVTSRWLDVDRASQPTDPDDRSKALAKQADMNETDLLLADIVVSFTDGLTGLTGLVGKGGRHVEFGFALARNKVVIIIGPRENVFHYHPRVILLTDADALIDDAGKRATEAQRRRP